MFGYLCQGSKSGATLARLSSNFATGYPAEQGTDWQAQFSLLHQQVKAAPSLPLLLLWAGRGT